MKKITWLFIFLLFGFHLSLDAQTVQTTQTDTISQRIVLIGDGGELTNGRHPVVEAIKQFIRLDKKKRRYFFLVTIYIRPGCPMINPPNTRQPKQCWIHNYLWRKIRRQEY